jgi:hypothetical protein
MPVGDWPRVSTAGPPYCAWSGPSASKPTNIVPERTMIPRLV